MANFDDVIREEEKVDYVELKDLEKERKKKELRDKYIALKENLSKAYQKGKEYAIKGKDFAGKVYKTSAEAYKKTDAKIQEFRNKGAKFHAYISKVNPRYKKESRRKIKYTGRKIDTRSIRNLQQNNYSDGIFSGISLQRPQNNDNIFGSIAPRQSNKQSDDFGMGNLFGGSSKPKKRKSNGMFDML